MRLRIGLIGDRTPEVRAHTAIPMALELAAYETGAEIETVWLATDKLTRNVEGQLSSCDGLWCVPGSPYASIDGALLGIRFAREHKRPFLGTCGGFQHALIEYARNVLGLGEADHAESNPTAAMPLVAPLSCSLVGAKGAITLREGSHVSEIYGATEIVERYHCNYGFNPQYQSLLEGEELTLTGVDTNGEARVVELLGHQLFIATLFQPELSALNGKKHPLITAFVQAVAKEHHLLMPVLTFILIWKELC